MEHEIRQAFAREQEQNIQREKDEQMNTDEVCIAFTNAFADTNDELFSGIMDIRFSGSTCVTVMTLG